MSYPVIDLRTARKVRDELLERRQNGEAVVDLQVSAGSDLDGRARDRHGDDVPLEAIKTASEAALVEWTGKHPDPDRVKANDRYQLEAEMAGVVHGALRDVPVATLADPDFWRYLALGPFRWFLLTREPKLQDHDFGGTDRDRKYWLLIRTFLWGQLAYDEEESDPYRRATIIGEVSKKELDKAGMVIDFWHSHMIRRHFAVNSTIALAFIDEATSEPFALDEGTKLEERHANAFARRMTRLRRSVDLSVATEVDESTATSLVHEQKMRTLGKWGDASPAGG